MFFSENVHWKKRFFAKPKKDLPFITRENLFLVSHETSTSWVRKVVSHQRFGTKLGMNQKVWFWCMPIWNLYRKKSKRFRTHGFVPNPSRLMFKRLRTDGFALSPFRIMSKRFRTDGFVQNLSEESLKKVSSRWFRTKPFKIYSTHEEALRTEKSFSSWASVHKVDPDEIRKTSIGCVSLALPSKVLIILLEL